jgi:hypothetical protein
VETSCSAKGHFKSDLPMPEDSFVRVLATLAPNVNTFLLTTLKRFARDKHLRVLGESTRKVVQVLEMFVIRVVAIEPRKVRKILRLVLAYNITITSAQPPQLQ